MLWVGVAGLAGLARSEACGAAGLELVAARAGRLAGLDDAVVLRSGRHPASTSHRGGPKTSSGATARGAAGWIRASISSYEERKHFAASAGGAEPAERRAPRARRGRYVRGSLRCGGRSAGSPGTRPPLLQTHSEGTHSPHRPHGPHSLRAQRGRGWALHHGLCCLLWGAPMTAHGALTPPRRAAPCSRTESQTTSICTTLGQRGFRLPACLTGCPERGGSGAMAAEHCLAMAWQPSRIGPAGPGPIPNWRRGRGRVSSTWDLHTNAPLSQLRDMVHR